MSWQFASFSILAVALLAGFAWYERSKPDSRIVALVGTLAAFGALGRIAFAAVPNVKPTTDIVLLAGYALGGAPGFVVGALAGLTSNFFFGQGPWTPWQMTAWGVTGLIGAGLARYGPWTLRRWPLAVVCAVTGYAFAAFQDVGDWVTYSDHSQAQLWVYVGKGTGFDFIHAGGCFVFALAFGPALARALGRFDRRLKVVWGGLDGAAVPLLVVFATGLAVAGLGVAGGSAGTSTAQAASTPASYLLAAQDTDGGFGASPGAAPSALYAGWAALGLAAYGHNPQDVTRDGHSVIDYIRGTLAQNTDPGSLERTILVVRAAGLSATSFGGRDLVSALEGDIRHDGSVSEQLNLTAFAILALRADGLAAPGASVAWLLRQQDSDGGFNYSTAGGSSDVDDTGAALEALAGQGGGADRVRAQAVSFLRHAQNGDGGFPSTPGGTSNAQSTAFAVQGLLASGIAPGSVQHSGASPLQYLSDLIGADGEVHYAIGADQTPVWVTGEAAMALAGKALPLASVPVSPSPQPAGQAHRGAGATAPGKAHHVAPSSRHGPRSTPKLAPGGPRAAHWLSVGTGVLTAIALAPLGI